MPVDTPASALNRQEILVLLRLHVSTLANYLEPQNYLPKHVMWGGAGPENRGGLKRINELFELLPERDPDSPGTGGE